MNLLSLIGPNVSNATYDDNSIGGPIQRTQNAYFNLLGAIHLANLYPNEGNNVARAARLNTFKVAWSSKAEKLLSYGPGTDPTAVEYSQDLYAEANAAIAVND